MQRKPFQNSHASHNAFNQVLFTAKRIPASRKQASQILSRFSIYVSNGLLIIYFAENWLTVAEIWIVKFHDVAKICATRTYSFFEWNGMLIAWICTAIFMAAMIIDATETEMGKTRHSVDCFLALCQREKWQTRHINDNRFMGACKLIKLQIVSTHQRQPSTNNGANIL